MEVMKIVMIDMREIEIGLLHTGVIIRTIQTHIILFLILLVKYKEWGCTVGAQYLGLRIGSIRKWSGITRPDKLVEFVGRFWQMVSFVK